ncbi:MAG TPA: MCP four helix bundle domain-containing protein, partial [Tepidisphaeraceae bacterium]|nr:MCP four helix bundle domain-containing protein [Tepidisphaeraceae bacterium]
MKNLSIALKMGLLVAVLLFTAFAIAVVGVRQLAHLNGKFEQMVNTTNRAMMKASEARVELLASVRAEKNAVVVQDKARAAEYAQSANEHREQMKLLRDELAKLVGSELATQEGKTVSELVRAIEMFEENQKEILRLAVIKS